MKINRDELEQSTLSFVVSAVFVFTIGVVLMMANMFFQWDLFPRFIESFLYFLAFVMVAMIVAATFINVLINVSQLTFYIKSMAQTLRDFHHETTRSH